MPFDDQGKSLKHVGDPKCSVCGTARILRMCKSYDRFAHSESAVIGAIVWAARRARRYAVQRERLRVRLIKAGLL